MVNLNYGLTSGVIQRKLGKVSSFLEQAETLIATPTFTHQGTEGVVGLLTDWMKRAQLTVKIQQVSHSREDISKKQFNVLGVLGDPLVDRQTRKGLLLFTHLDTALPGSNQLWSQTGLEPLQATVHDKIFFGLGAADGKVDFLCKLKAIEKFYEKKLRSPVYLVGTCGEKAGLLGARYFLKSGVFNPKYVLVGHPTGLKLSVTQKMVDVMACEIQFQALERGARGLNRKVILHGYGQVGHSAFPYPKSNHALLTLMDFIQKSLDNGFEIKMTKLHGGQIVEQVPDQGMAEIFLTSHQLEDFKRFYRELSRTEKLETRLRMEVGGVGDAGVSFLPDKAFQALRDIVRIIQETEQSLQMVSFEGFDYGYPSFHLASIERQDQKLSLQFEMRLPPSMKKEEIFLSLESKIQKAATHYPHLGIRLKTLYSTPGLVGQERIDFLEHCGEAMEKADMMPNLMGTSLGTAAGLFADKGYPVAIFGPGEARNNIHGPNESVAIDDYKKAIQFYERIIERACS